MNVYPIVPALGIWAQENNPAHDMTHLRILGVNPIQRIDELSPMHRVNPMSESYLLTVCVYAPSAHEPVPFHYK